MDPMDRSPKYDMNIRISHAGSKDQYKADTSDHGW